MYISHWRPVEPGQRPCSFIQATLVNSRPSTHWHTTYQLSAQWTRLYIYHAQVAVRPKLPNAAENPNDLPETYRALSSTYVGRSLRCSQSPALCVWKVGRLTRVCCKTGWGEHCTRKLRASMAAVGLVIAAQSAPVLLPCNDA